MMFLKVVLFFIGFILLFLLIEWIEKKLKKKNNFNSKLLSVTIIFIQIISLIVIVLGMTYFSYKSLIEDGISNFQHLFMLLIPIFFIYFIYEFIRKKFLPKNALIKLQLLDRKNFHYGTSYDVIYLDIPFGYTPQQTEWIDSEMIDKNIVINIDSIIFEEIFNKFLNQFQHYDCYKITDFCEDNSSKLCSLLENEKQFINNISKNDFEKKYEWIFNSIRDKGDFKLTYNIEKEFDMVFSDINLTIDTLIIYLKKSINEKKCVTIIGI